MIAVCAEFGSFAFWHRGCCCSGSRSELIQKNLFWEKVRPVWPSRVGHIVDSLKRRSWRNHSGHRRRRTWVNTVERRSERVHTLVTPGGSYQVVQFWKVLWWFQRTKPRWILQDMSPGGPEFFEIHFCHQLPAGESSCSVFTKSQFPTGSSHNFWRGVRCLRKSCLWCVTVLQQPSGEFEGSWSSIYFNGWSPARSRGRSTKEKPTSPHAFTTRAGV